MNEDLIIKKVTIEKKDRKRVLTFSTAVKKCYFISPTNVRVLL